MEISKKKLVASSKCHTKNPTWVKFYDGTSVVSFCSHQHGCRLDFDHKKALARVCLLGCASDVHRAYFWELVRIHSQQDVEQLFDDPRAFCAERSFSHSVFLDVAPPISAGQQVYEGTIQAFGGKKGRITSIIPALDSGVSALDFYVEEVYLFADQKSLPKGIPNVTAHLKAFLVFKKTRFAVRKVSNKLLAVHITDCRGYPFIHDKLVAAPFQLSQAQASSEQGGAEEEKAGGIAQQQSSHHAVGLIAGGTSLEPSPLHFPYSQVSLRQEVSGKGDGDVEENIVDGKIDQFPESVNVNSRESGGGGSNHHHYFGTIASMDRFLKWGQIRLTQQVPQSFWATFDQSHREQLLVPFSYKELHLFSRSKPAGRRMRIILMQHELIVGQNVRFQVSKLKNGQTGAVNITSPGGLSVLQPPQQEFAQQELLASLNRNPRSLGPAPLDNISAPEVSLQQEEVSVGFDVEEKVADEITDQFAEAVNINSRNSNGCGIRHYYYGVVASFHPQYLNWGQIQLTQQVPQSFWASFDQSRCDREQAIVPFNHKELHLFSTPKATGRLMRIILMRHQLIIGQSVRFQVGRLRNGITSAVKITNPEGLSLLQPHQQEFAERELMRIKARQAGNTSPPQQERWIPFNQAPHVPLMNRAETTGRIYPYCTNPRCTFQAGDHYTKDCLEATIRPPSQTRKPSSMIQAEATRRIHPYCTNPKCNAPDGDHHTMGCPQVEMRRRKWSQKKMQRFDHRSAAHGIRPPGFAQQFKVPLPDYTVPKWLKRLLREEGGGEVEVHRFAAEVGRHLEGLPGVGPLAEAATPAALRTTLAHLLWAEEAGCRLDLAQYAIEGALLAPDDPPPAAAAAASARGGGGGGGGRARRRGGGANLHVLRAAGLAEKRPSVLRGDSVNVYQPITNRYFKGYVHHVNLEDVRLSLPHSFQHQYPCNVSFTLNRTMFRTQHRALAELPPGLARLLLEPRTPPGAAAAWAAPAEERPGGCAVMGGALRGPTPEERWERGAFHEVPFQATLNEEQKVAVRQMASPLSVVWGPPGTGKTFTLVEGILQLLKHAQATGTRCKVLVTAPSNEAVDVICERVLGYRDRFRRPIRVFRMNAVMRDPKTIKSAAVLGVSRRDERGGGGGFLLPSLAELEGKLDVVCCTCAAAAYLVSLGARPGLFTHVVVDEAAQATEPLALIPLSLCAVGKKNALQDAHAHAARATLAGDPKQLGPVVRSAAALGYGLHFSILERAVEGGELYRGPIAPVSLLARNYRSHPVIVSLFSMLFYEHRLRACRSVAISENVLKWQGWPNREVPMLFLHTEGTEARDEDSPSWHNPIEKDIVVSIVGELLNGGYVDPAGVGIITPYLKQVQKIKQSLNGHFHQEALFDYRQIKTGTVESFQGDERDLVVLSCVRSAPRHLKHDRKFALGFLSNFRRLNVAISRPRAGLIIVGNARLLRTDPHWRQLLHVLSLLGVVGGATPALLAELMAAADEEKGEGLEDSKGGREDAGEEKESMAVDLPWTSVVDQSV